MAQISLYMNDGIMGALRDRSAREGLSLSKYVARIIEEHVTGKENGWPIGYWDSVYGCIDDETAEEMKAAIAFDSLDASLDDDCSWFTDDAAPLAAPAAHRSEGGRCVSA